MAQKMKCDVLSIDAWADGDEGWTWNAWYKAHDPVYLDNDISDNELLEQAIELGLIAGGDQSLYNVNDDQYNMVIEDAETCEPLFAFAYGAYPEENQL